ncbi:ALF repeat-containing protein, partial [Streptomyces rimosus]
MAAAATAAVIFGTTVAHALPAQPGEAAPAQDARARAVEAWKAGGAATKREAVKALTGSDADMNAFLGGALHRAEVEDARFAILKTMASAGKGVSAASDKALTGSDEEVLA